LLIGCDRMGTRCSSRSREALNWKSLWMLIVTDSRLTSTLLLFSLMVVAFVLSRLLMRFVFPSSFFIDSTSQLFNFSTVQLLVLTWTFIFAVGNGGWWWNWCNASSDWRFCILSISASSPIDVTELKKIFL